MRDFLKALSFLEEESTVKLVKQKMFIVSGPARGVSYETIKATLKTILLYQHCRYWETTQGLSHYKMYMH